MLPVCLHLFKPTFCCPDTVGQSTRHQTQSINSNDKKKQNLQILCNNNKNNKSVHVYPSLHVWNQWIALRCRHSWHCLVEKSAEKSFHLFHMLKKQELNVKDEDKECIENVTEQKIGKETNKKLQISWLNHLGVAL